MERDTMNKKIRLTRVAEQQDENMTVKKIIAQLESIKDNASSCLCGDADFDADWQADIKACDAVIYILTVLGAAGVRTQEQLRDMVSNYSFLYKKIEVAEKPDTHGGKFFCPWCHKRNQPGHNHCWYCGKYLDWE